MIEIGNVEIPIVSGINPSAEASVDEIEPINTQTVAVKHEKDVTELLITGYLNQSTHSQSKTINEQKKDVKSLRRNTVEENTIDYKDWKGHLSIENIDMTDDSDSKIINEVEITAKYHPWPQFYADDEP